MVIEPRDGYLFVSVADQRPELQNVIHWGDEISKAVASTGLRRALILRRDPLLKEPSEQQVASYFLRNNLPPDTRIAVVFDDHAAKEDETSTARALRKTGLDVRVFHEEGEARDWLLANE